VEKIPALEVKKEDSAGKNAVIVLGMHRSGTSLLIRVLEAMGADLGDNCHKGLAENLSLMRADERLLREIGNGWQTASPLREDWVRDPAVTPFREEIRNILATEFASSSLFSFKDPRISLLLPLYLEVLRDLGIDPHFVVIERKDLEVARSLAVRNRIPLGTSIRMCRRYRESINRFSEGQKRVYVHFDDLVRNPESVVNTIHDAFELPLKEYRQVRDGIAAIIDTTRKHHNLTVFNKALYVLSCAFPGTYFSARDRIAGIRAGLGGSFAGKKGRR